MIDMWEMDKGQLEEMLDGAKVLVIGALVTEGLLDRGTADTWCGAHTLVLRRRKWWKRLIEKNEDLGGCHIHVVKDVQDARNS